MFRNAFAFVIIASALALTGCSKCSEQPAADAPAADMAAPAADMAAPAPGAEATPADATAPGTAPTPEGAPAAAK